MNIGQVYNSISHYIKMSVYLPFPNKGKIFCIGTSISPSPLVSYLTTHDPSLCLVLCVISITTALDQRPPSQDFANTRLPTFKLSKSGSLHS